MGIWQVQSRSLKCVSSHRLALKERTHSLLHLKHRSLSITAWYTTQLHSALQLFCHIWCLESLSSTSEGSYDKLPSTLIFHWKQVEAITSHLTKWNIFCSALTQSFIVSLDTCSWVFCPRAESYGNSQTSFSILAETHRDIVSATHPNPSSFTVNLTSHMTPRWHSIPLRQGLCRTTVPLLLKLSVYINPSTFTEEVYKPSRSCYSIAILTF